MANKQTICSVTYLLLMGSNIIGSTTSLNKKKEYLPSTTVVAERYCFHKRVSRILSMGRLSVSQHALGQTLPR